MPKSRAVPAAALFAAFVIAGLAACSSGPVVADEPAEKTPAAESSTPTPEAEPEAEAGSRENPVPVGTAAKHSAASMWSFTLAATDADAWPEITATNEFNQAAPEGSTYISVPVHIVAEENEAAKDGADPWASFKVEYVTAGGNSYDDMTCTVVLPAPGSLNELGTMYGPAEADFLACAAVPVADIPGGTWKVSSLIDGNYSVFFAGA